MFFAHDASHPILYIKAEWPGQFFMIDDLISDAMRLTSEGDYLAASTLWLNLSQTPDLDISSRCLYLLNERRCRTALGQHEIAQQILKNIAKIDSDCLFRLEVEYGWIDDLYAQGRYADANKKSEIFAGKNALKLASPEFAILSYEQKLALGCGYVHTEDFAAGLQLLTDIFSDASDSHDKRQILYYRSLAYKGLNQEASEISDLKQIVEAQEVDFWVARAHYDLGYIYQIQRAFVLAKYHLQIAESLKQMLTVPVSYVYHALSSVCSRLNEVNEAKRYKELADSELE